MIKWLKKLFERIEDKANEGRCFMCGGNVVNGRCMQCNAIVHYKGYKINVSGENAEEVKEVTENIMNKLKGNETLGQKSKFNEVSNENILLAQKHISNGNLKRGLKLLKLFCKRVISRFRE